MSRRVFAAGAVVGLVAAPVLTLGGLLLADELVPGLRIECRGLLAGGGVCRWDSGPMDSTPRLLARARWQWHRRRKLRGGWCRP